MSVSKPWTLVTPASRGIGLALARHLLRNTGAPVVATFRKAEADVRKRILDGLTGVEGRLKLLEIDVKKIGTGRLKATDEATMISAAEEASQNFPKKSHHLQLAFAIPGILYPEKSPSQIDAEKALETFQVNVVANMLLIKHFSPFLPRKSTVFASDEDDFRGLPKRNAVFALMSARVGSITDNKAGGWYSYRASKAGVTQLARTLDVHLKASAGDKAMAVALHPGTVRTDFTEGYRDAYEKAGKVITAENSAEALITNLENMSIDQRSRFWDWKGEEIPF